MLEALVVFALIRKAIQGDFFSPYLSFNVIDKVNRRNEDQNRLDHVKSVEQEPMVT